MKWLIIIAVLWISAVQASTLQVAPFAGSSSLSIQEARSQTWWWTFQHPDRKVFVIAPPGLSMLPTIDEHCLLLAEYLLGEPNLNDICIYDRGLTTVCHRAIRIDSKHHRVMFQGDGNQFKDGWIDMSRIHWRVVMIVYTKR